MTRRQIYLYGIRTSVLVYDGIQIQDFSHSKLGLFLSNIVKIIDYWFSMVENVFGECGKAVDKLQSLIVYVLQQFPRKLWRTELVKVLYLIDCEWYKLYEKTFTEVRYVREKKGPLAYDFYDASNALVEGNFISMQSFPGWNRTSFQYGIGTTGMELQLNPEVEQIANFVMDQLKDKNFDEILSIAYSTAPMQSIQRTERRLSPSGNGILRGMGLNMDKLNRPKPKFTLEELRENLNKLDLSERGSDEEYTQQIAKEHAELTPLRERVSRCLQ